MGKGLFMLLWVAGLAVFVVLSVLPAGVFFTGRAQPAGGDEDKQ